MKRLLALVFASVVAAHAWADAGPTLRVDFSDPKLIPAQWTLVLHEDGSAHFHSERGKAPADDKSEMDPVTLDRDVKLNEQFAEKMFALVRRQPLSDNVCESHMKVAFQGWKKISYSGPEGAETCQFNYSKNKGIQQLGDSMVAVAATILEGARLEMLRQHDPLGLDKEMEFVVDASKDGRLQQICAIRGILEQLEADPAVLERVRKRARMLLAQAER